MLYQLDSFLTSEMKSRRFDMNVEIDVPTIRGRCTPLRKTGSNTERLAPGGKSHDLLEKSADFQESPIT